MKKYTLIIIVAVITLIASFPLLSCKTDTSLALTTPPAPAIPSATTPATSSPPPTTTTTPVGALPTTTTTSPAPSTPTPTPTPTVTPDLPDLKPYLVDGKSAVTVDTSGTDYKKFLVKAGVTNAGKLTADSVSVELYNGTTKIYTWNAGPLKVGENKVLETTVEDILKQTQILPGLYNLNINCVVSGGGKESDITNNKSNTCTAMLALSPVAEQQSQSATIQYSIKNSTLYTASNQAELLTILKEVLKDANISWGTFSLELLSFDKYNELYGNTYGTTDAEKQSIKTSIANSKYPGTCFLYGNTGSAIICVREGILVQVLPAILYQLGIIDYGQINYGGYTNGQKGYGTRLAGSLMEAYGIRIMREKYGFSGVTNISATLTLSQFSGQLLSPSSSTTIWRMWAIAAEEGFPNGDLPSAKVLKAFFALTSKADPATYLADLDKKAASLDKKAIESLIRWRLVNKEVTSLPADATLKIGTSSLDVVISYQEFVAFPW